MKDGSTQSFEAHSQTCILQCQDAFIGYAARQAVGGVEALRICKELCREKSLEKPLTR